MACLQIMCPNICPLELLAAKRTWEVRANLTSWSLRPHLGLEDREAGGVSQGDGAGQVGRGQALQASQVVTVVQGFCSEWWEATEESQSGE